MQIRIFGNAANMWNFGGKLFYPPGVIKSTNNWDILYVPSYRVRSMQFCEFKFHMNV